MCWGFRPGLRFNNAARSKRLAMASLAVMLSFGDFQFLVMQLPGDACQRSFCFSVLIEYL
jgi:hypothetical protein